MISRKVQTKVMKVFAVFIIIAMVLFLIGPAMSTF
jgi:hypothetical protein